MIFEMDVPEEIKQQVYYLRLPSFWMAKDGSKWVAVAVGVAGPNENNSSYAAAPGTCVAHIKDLFLSSEGSSVDEVVLAIIEQLRDYIKKYGAKIPKDNYIFDPETDESGGYLALQPNIWSKSFSMGAARLGDPLVFGNYVPVRITQANDGLVTIESVSRNLGV